jgi:hypothetical protein
LYDTHSRISAYIGEDSYWYGRYTFQAAEEKFLGTGEGRGDLSIVCEP